MRPNSTLRRPVACRQPRPDGQRRVSSWILPCRTIASISTASISRLWWRRRSSRRITPRRLILASATIPNRGTACGGSACCSGARFQARKKLHGKEETDPEGYGVLHPRVGWRRAAFALMNEKLYSTAMQHHVTMEPHATVAAWEGDQLTIYEPSTPGFTARGRPGGSRLAGVCRRKTSGGDPAFRWRRLRLQGLDLAPSPAAPGGANPTAPSSSS